MEPVLEQAEVEAEVAATEQTLSRRLVMSVSLTPDDFRSGKILPLVGGPKAFFPAGEGLEKGSFSKGIVRRISVQSVSSDYDQPVHIAMNLFSSGKGAYTNPDKLSNKVGWLYTDAGDGVSSSGQAGSYTNLLSVLPNEVGRMNQVVYEPTNELSSRYIAKFGGYTTDSLRAGIVPFAGKSYVYVPQDHVVMSVIRNNWESLGINADLEAKRENEFIKVDGGVVNKVIAELDDHVLKQMPFTNFETLGVHYSAPESPMAADDQRFTIVTEFKIEYMFPKVE
jgi:hypothetical protein